MWYADKTMLLADSPEGLQELLFKVNKISDKYGLTLNVNKIQIHGKK